MSFCRCAEIWVILLQYFRGVLITHNNKNNVLSQSSQFGTLIMSTTSTATAVNSCEHCEHCGQPTKQSTIPFGLTRVPISHSKDQRSSSWFEAPEFPTFELEYPDFTTFEDVEYDEPLVSKDDDKQVYPSGFRLATIVSALCLAVFCVALDNTVSNIGRNMQPVSLIQIDHCDGDSSDHKSLSQPRRCRMVW
jgi:hypothetical protein